MQQLVVVVLPGGGHQKTPHVLSSLAGGAARICAQDKQCYRVKSRGHSISPAPLLRGLVATPEERAAMGSKIEEVGELTRHAEEETLTLDTPTTPLMSFHTLRVRPQVTVREMRQVSVGQVRRRLVDTLLFTCELAIRRCTIISNREKKT